MAVLNLELWGVFGVVLVLPTLRGLVDIVASRCGIKGLFLYFHIDNNPVEYLVYNFN